MSLKRETLKRMVRDLENQEILELSQKKIQFIDEKTFHGLENVKVIDLSINKLNKSSLNPKVFDGLKNLEKIYFNRNDGLAGVEHLALYIEDSVKHVSFNSTQKRQDIDKIENVCILCLLIINFYNFICFEIF